MGGCRSRFWRTLAAALTALCAAVPAAMAAEPERGFGLGVTVERGAETGPWVTFVGAEPGDAIPLSPTAPRAAASAAVERFGPSFGLRGGADVEATEVARLDGGRSAVRFQQEIDGLPVIGGELIVNLDPNGDLLSIGGELAPARGIDAEPAVGEAEAAQAALAATARRHGVDEAGLEPGAGELSVYDSRLLGGPGLGIPRPVWRFEVVDGAPRTIRELVLVDAELGNVALSFSQIHGAKSRRVCDAAQSESKTFCLFETAARVEGGGPHAQPEVNAAYDLSGGMYDLYFNRFGRDSIDGAGMPLVSTVRFCAGGCPYDNAFWNGEQMTFGPGWVTDDILGHEMTHGVVERESGLFYYYQSGAINESFADVFGELFDLTSGSDSPGDRWLMSEESPVGAIRSMSNPPAFGDPDRMGSPNWFFEPETSFEVGDGGGVHFNSGVNNKAAYLLTDGGSFNGRAVGGLGIDKVLRLYYEVNASLLTSAGDYADLAAGLRQACSNLTGQHGFVAADCVQVDNALLATEMDSPPPPGEGPGEAATCASPGQSPVLAFSDDLENPASGNWAVGSELGEEWFFYPQNSHSFEFDATYATSGQTNIWGYTPDIASGSTIEMTAGVTVPAGGLMRFRHAYGFDTEAGGNFDGGTVEYSTDGGSSWLDAGAMIVAGDAYSGTLADGDSNPLAGRVAFTGESGGYGSSRLDLSSLAGQQVRFRFHLGTDAIVDDYGWFIDDVQIYHCAGPVDPPPDDVIIDPTDGGGGGGGGGTTGSGGPTVPPPGPKPSPGPGDDACTKARAALARAKAKLKKAGRKLQQTKRSAHKGGGGLGRLERGVKTNKRKVATALKTVIRDC